MLVFRMIRFWLENNNKPTDFLNWKMNGKPVDEGIAQLKQLGFLEETHEIEDRGIALASRYKYYLSERFFEFIEESISTLLKEERYE